MKNSLNYKKQLRYKQYTALTIKTSVTKKTRSNLKRTAVYIKRTVGITK